MDWNEFYSERKPWLDVRLQDCVRSGVKGFEIVLRIDGPVFDANDAVDKLMYWKDHIEDE